MASAGKEIDILLAGRTGNGKSATGNSILMHRAFESVAGATSVTKVADRDCSHFKDTVIKVVDTPGVGDTELTSSEGVLLVGDAMAEAIALSPKGFHAILIVRPYNKRFTHAEIEDIKVLKRIFGESFLIYHAILCLTRGDDFVNSQGGRSIVQWCNDQKGGFAELYAECRKRVVLFDNKTKDRKIQEKQLHDLLNMIDQLTANGIRYTSDIFKTAHEAREAFMNDPAQVFLSEDIMKEFGLINEQLLKVDTEDPEENLKGLIELQNRVDSLERQILTIYGGTKVLPMAKIHLDKLKSPISTRIKLTENLMRESQGLHEKLKRETEKAREAYEALRREQNQNIFRVIVERIKRAFRPSMKDADM